MLGGLQAGHRTELLTLGTPLRFERGRRIIEEDDTSTFVLLIKAGFVKVTGRLEDGREALLAVRTRGDLVGELAALDGGPRSGSVTACSPLEGNVLRQGEFLGLLGRRPAISLALHRMSAFRLRQANRRRLDFTGCAAPVRVARVLVELVETYGRSTPRGRVSDIRITQNELADLSGTSTETAQITLRRLRRAGALRTGYRRLEVLDMRTLHDAAHLTS
jgi:CRP-like cAMP-binding protein